MQERAWQSRIRETFFIDGPLPELKAEVHRRFEPAPGVTAEAVSYSTQFGTRVPAVLYLPKPLPAGKIPGFIVVNGHGGDKYSWYSFYSGILYARAGAAVLTYDQAGEGERNSERQSGTRAHDQLQVDAEIARRQAGLMVTDVMQAVSYLASRPEVDAKRIGAAGYSLGSFVLAMAGALETRLHAAVLACGGNLDGPGEYWDNSKSMCQGLPYQSLAFLGDRAAGIYALHAARGPTLVYNGAADTVVNMHKTGAPFMADLHARTVNLRGKAEGVFEFDFVPDVSHRPFFVTRPVALWLHRQLKFPNWTEGKIKSLPETRIGDWAAANGVAMDRLYATEEREGGALALGKDFPGFRREELSIFRAEEWEQRKKEFVIETWYAAALAAAQAGKRAETGWIKHPQNPLLSLGTDQDFDRQNIFAPAVIKDGANYFLFYSGGPSGPRTGEELVRYQLGLAQSADGVKWTKRGPPLLELGERDNFHATPALLRNPDGQLHKVDGLWHIVYCGNRADDVEHATSRDGISWEKDPMNPIYRRAYAPNLLQVGDKIWMYSIHKPPRKNGQAVPWEVHLATGRDFRSLKPHAANPVLVVSQPWEKGALFYPYVLREGKTWVMLYASYWREPAVREQRTAIGMATSADGVKWTKAESNPVLTPTPGSPYDSLYTSSHCVLRVGDLYRLYYASRIDMIHKYYAIGLATKRGPLVPE